MSGWRLDEGGLIDRAQPIAFDWGGRRLRGFAGDSLASALLASGETTIGRSFKLHRPRGLLGAGVEEPGAIVDVGAGAWRLPNLKATQVELYDGLSARAVNAWPSPRVDALGWIGALHRFLPPGFYYKTFKRPDWTWFEPHIRRLAGLGRVPDGPDPDRYAQRFAHVDHLIVGGGITGLMAARTAARAGEQTMLVELEPLWGGWAAGSDWPVEGMPAREWIAATLAELAAAPHIALHNRTTAAGLYDGDLVALDERLSDHLAPGERSGPRRRFWRVRAGRITLASGAFEQPLLFSGNDRPGVMLASAAWRYLHRHAVVPGRRIVVATDNDSGHVVAAALAARGAVPVAVIDSRGMPPGGPGERIAGRVIDTAGTPLRSVAVALADGTTRSIAADALLMSGGWAPVLHLAAQGGAAPVFCAARRCFVLPDGPVALAGMAAGDFDFAPDSKPQPPRDPARAWIDWQNDVTAADIGIAAREGYRSVEHLKRYTTLGMAPDQGKTSNLGGIVTLGAALDRAAGAVGTTRFRPPFDPVPLGALAGAARGALLHPPRQLPAAGLHARYAAVFEDYGGWARPAHYGGDPAAEAEAVLAEARAVRTRIGLFDASPLGKIELRGPDAGRFLDRLYVNTLSTLKVGGCRYALAANDHGIVIDDGVVARLGAEHFVLGTTTGQARAMFAAIEEWLACEWPDLAVLAADVTTSWAVWTVAGREARTLLERLPGTIALVPDAFPHLASREGEIAGVPARVQRVSFTGELSYEIAVPAEAATMLGERLLDLGADLGIRLFGIEALMLLRTEKGFLHVGSDTDGATMPHDVGFGAAMARKQGDFVGRGALALADAQRAGRRQLVGLVPVDGDAPLALGGHVIAAGAPAPGPTLGWVTSSHPSVALPHPVALGLVADGPARIGETVEVWDLGTRRAARIVEPCQFDPAGERMRG